MKIFLLSTVPSSNKNIKYLFQEIIKFEMIFQATEMDKNGFKKEKHTQ